MNYSYVSSATNSCIVQFTPGRNCLTYAKDCTDCTCDEASRAVRICESIENSYNYYDAILEGYVTWILVALGLAANTLLLLTLMQPAFSGISTFLYLRLIAAIGLILLIVQAARKIVRSFPEYNVYHWEALAFLYSFTYISDSGKLIISSFSVFLCLERLLSITTPVFHSGISKPKFVWLQLLASVAVGCVPLIFVGDVLFPMDGNTGRYIVIPLSVLSSSREYPVNCAVFSIRLIECLLMIGVSSMTVVQLKLRNKRLKTMLIAGAAVKEEKRSVKLCRFQALEATVVISELILLCLYDLLEIVPAQYQGGRSITFSEFVAFVPVIRFNYVARLLQIVLFQFSQIFLLILYICFSPTFRKELTKLMPCFFDGGSDLIFVLKNTNVKKV